MRDTSVVVCTATSATTTARARISRSRRMLPSRAPSSHPRRDASLPCPRSADSTTATSAAQRSRWRRTLSRWRREQSAIGACATVLLPAARSTCAHVQVRGTRHMMVGGVRRLQAMIGTTDRVFSWVQLPGSRFGQGQAVMRHDDDLYTRRSDRRNQLAHVVVEADRFGCFLDSLVELPPSLMKSL